MLSRLIDGYKQNIPKDVPLATFRSATASALMSTVWGESHEETCQNVLVASIASLFSAIILEPMIKTVFSDQSQEKEVFAKIGFTVLTGLALRSLSEDRSQPPRFPWSGIIIAAIMNHSTPQDSASVYVYC